MCCLEQIFGSSQVAVLCSSHFVLDKYGTAPFPFAKWSDIVLCSIYDTEANQYADGEDAFDMRKPLQDKAKAKGRPKPRDSHKEEKQQPEKGPAQATSGTQ